MRKIPNSVKRGGAIGILHGNDLNNDTEETIEHYLQTGDPNSKPGDKYIFAGQSFIKTHGFVFIAVKKQIILKKNKMIINHNFFFK